MSVLESSSVVYELTVVGALGPALCHALTPFAHAISEAHTILRAELPDGLDLVDLMGVMEAKGLDVVDVVEVR
ncbi:MAG TPA: hypothetical protein VLB29_18520 [Nocardioidaceae bacterium]|nr:hypothetical protein [Nocardioidaceae bacterium]